VLYLEALSNPLVQALDLPATAAWAAAHNLTFVIDATFATPVNLRPLAAGAHLVVHSATKYLNGHSDVIAGVVAGSKQHIHKVSHT
jgi:cystathionine beta-lyase/cystathionine gamma-synthase